MVIAKRFTRIMENMILSLNDHMAPFVMRYLLSEKITENDRVFYHKGMLAKFIEDPEIHINFEHV